ncbi:hypothetical protein [Flavobacterium johnsoniae]|jgi:hypothetical protein|uniref:Roadblock/LC7 domain-containing protein n=2 Tax=Flavobacterium johnsoniae TaxID=986 RepID=A0A1M6P028_FLAJO|nr:hypothetical protein [Flavobacterium johnsoniae]ABQ03737.1 hypothetical protein Fjoh_0702 [Flavobacterium johnsoniae UW101]OXG03259.1 hypothetical protein B0A63_00370 [Flavobacterium johnsoniae UW101]WQG79398.1 hypothetical protein SR927_15350 [Flavobacterium johnsoniae UW101]SHH33128.1 hypothetical protein SAMN05444388_109112 [Flavobacterium johnsoniae]SHK01268.1 hypothetical protein SAMN05444146_0104 [Flavobacterium johnsoniae]
MSNDFLNVFLNEMKTNVNGFIAVAVTEIESGLSFGNITVDPAFDPELAAAYNLEVVKAKLNAVKALGLNQDIEDILITLSNQIHIIDISPNKKFMIYLAADANKANLGMTRAVLRKHKADLEKNLA